jgi:bile acid-coenzyme A ligase
MSESVVAEDQPISNVECLRRLARERPDEVAYVHVARDGGERSVSWDELERRSTQVAGAFARRGVGFGDLVGLGIRNSPELVFAVLGCWKLGAVPVPVRWDVPDWELDRLKQAIDPTLYLSPDDLVWVRATADDDVPELPLLVSPHANGICSSGSTGTPKVILVAGPAEFNELTSVPIAEGWGRTIARPQRILVLAPMYHVNAFATLNAMLTGDQLFVMEKFDAVRAVDALERHRLTTFTATPTMLQRIVDVPGVDDRDLTSLEWIMQGAAPMPPSLVHRWADLIGAEKIIMAYGGTEGLGITVLDGLEWMAHPGSVGRGYREAELRILDDDGHDLPTGEIGHIYLRNPLGQGPATYLGEVPQIPTTDDEFASYGDMGHLDEDGFLYIADRRVDLIITGGANVFPAEVEAALIDHAKIADVVVLGLEDPEWGRRVHAVIEPVRADDPPTFDEVRAYVKSRLLPYKVPKSIEIVDAIPRSEAMKVNRGRMVEERGG